MMRKRTGRGPFLVAGGKRRKRSFLVAGSVILLGGAVAVLRWRDRLMPRRDPRRPYEELGLVTADGLRLAARRIAGGDRGAVIVAHPAVTGQRYSPLVDLAEMVAEHFDVYTFDFRGHGRSAGWLELDLRGPVEDLRSVVAMVREHGYTWVGAVGFSLGGMAAFIYAATYGGLDAVITVGAPPLLPDIERYRRILPAWSMFLLFLGARFRALHGKGGPLPMDAAEHFPEVPLLIIHGGNEVFYSREDLDAMLARLGRRAELWVIEGAGHTELAGREADLVDWLVARG